MDASKKQRRRSRRRPVLMILGILLLVWAASAAYQALKPIPPGFSFASPLRPADDLQLLVDQTYQNSAGERVSDQEIFDEVFRLIDQAQRLIVVDMFLFNEFAASEGDRPLTRQLTDALVAASTRNPTLEVILITDPFNHLYGGVEAPHLRELEAAQVHVVSTKVSRLPASNPVWSGLWHLCCSYLGNDTEGGWMPSVVSDDKVTLRTYLHLLNFRANHRKTLVVDQGDTWVGLVTSANPQDASSHHSNSATRFTGAAALDLLESERAVLALAGMRAPGANWPQQPRDESANPETGIQILTEGAIRDAIVGMIDSARAGDRIYMEVFYLSYRPLIDALVDAHNRGADIRVILDPNRDAFGQEKNGLPNRQAAWDLHKAGIELRWCFTEGEQCHRKWIRIDRADGTAELITGSANFTRRNLADLNLETSVRIVGSQDHPVLTANREMYRRMWTNEDGEKHSVPYREFSDHSWFRYGLYRVMEATGLSTF